MNLSALMNSGPEEEQKNKSPKQPRANQPPPLMGASGPYPQASNYGGPAQGPPQMFHPPPPSANTARSSSQGLTPLQMPPQPPGIGQHHLQPPPAQSPAGVQQFRPFDNHSATPPSGRPGSHGYLYPQPSPSQHPPGMPTSAHAHTNSLSPTPSHHSQTPHSVRQSPLSAMSHAPHPQQHPQHPYQHSQPSTPLGPPPPQFSRSATHPDLGSPYHQRTYSGASNGVPSGSPAQHYPNIGHLTESPNATYNNRPSPQLRRTSDYLSQFDRERSLSVSPKTKVAPRPPSLGSRHSSQQDLYSSNRSSTQTMSGGRLAGSPSHVMQPQQYHLSGPPPQLFAHPPNPASAVSQQTPYSSQGVPNPFAQPGLAENSRPLSQHSNYQPAPAPPPLLHQHSQQKMGMSNLLTPINETPPSLNGNSGFAEALPRQDMAARPDPIISMKPGHKSKAAVNATPPRPQQGEQLDQRQVNADSAQENSAGALYSDPKPSLKRPATEVPAQQPPLKQRKTAVRKYAHRPPWAQISNHNPRFHEQRLTQNGGQSQRTQQQQLAAPQTQTQPQPQLNGEKIKKYGDDVPNYGDLDERDAWMYYPPRDMDLIHGRQILGDKWEKTFKWNTPAPDMLRALQDWLWQNLEQLGDIGTNPEEGTIEIEGKIGTLIDNNTDRRLQLPVITMCVMQPDQGNRFSFRSEMGEAEHKHLNDYLNASTQNAKHMKGRTEIKYEHLYETDSFHHLSSTGLQLLPPAFQRRQNSKKEHRLRVTTDTKAGGIKARLVKIKIADFHIYNPAAYDSRITINVEVNLNRDGVDARTLIAANDAERGNEAPRVKDRLSYKHLAYSIDLTKVEMQGMPPRYELEQEVDSALLRRHMQNVKDRKASGFADVVSGFLDNLIFLMRERAPQAG